MRLKLKLKSKKGRYGWRCLGEVRSYLFKSGLITTTIPPKQNSEQQFLLTLASKFIKCREIFINILKNILFILKFIYIIVCLCLQDNEHERTLGVGERMYRLYIVHFTHTFMWLSTFEGMCCKDRQIKT